MKKLNCILLIDDNPADNRFHQILLEEMNVAEKIQIAESGFEALAYLKDKNNVSPELILLDIGMPKMNGWEFLKEFKKMDAAKRAQMVLVILTSGKNPDDINRAPQIDIIREFELKPLSKRIVNDIMKRHFTTK